MTGKLSQNGGYKNTLRISNNNKIFIDVKRHACIVNKE
jgi:hypothetical protein